ncbi:MAG: arginine--tRNA ligase [Bacteroidia bacterium]
MMELESLLAQQITQALSSLYTLDVTCESIVFQKTNKEFEGDITLVVFPYLKASKKGPEQTASDIGSYLQTHCPEVEHFTVVKGFLNLIIGPSFWLGFFEKTWNLSHYGMLEKGSSGKTVMIEYSSPNTNKPLHLGHIRNNLLGYSVASILQANGHKVIMANLVNDRGVHICKSMLAWKKWGQAETPSSSGMKGDHLVGKYYVEFDKRFKEEVRKLEAEGVTKELAEKQAPLMKEVQQMLLAWEAGDAETVGLWKTMNSWVYEGFDLTYKRLGVAFDKVYYESETYLLGKKIVEEGLAKQVFFRKEDGSVWIDLTQDKLDQKVLLRSDGTSVYMTQDLGTAAERFREFPELNQLIYTVANEQDYHFRVLFLILQKLGYEQAKNCYHLSYGMVELPEGKMKSREGTVVDADDLMDEMVNTAREMTLELGKTEDLSAEEAENLYRQIGMAALKYFILKVDPKKKMVFDPKESIDFNGNTGPFIQYSYARIQSLIRKSRTRLNFSTAPFPHSYPGLLGIEKELIKILYRFPAEIQQAGKEYNPGVVANYVFDLAKSYSSFFQTVPVLKDSDDEKVAFRLRLSNLCAQVIRNSMAMLGIEVPESM